MLRGDGIPSVPSLVMEGPLRKTTLITTVHSRAAVSESVPYSEAVEGWLLEEECD